MIPLCLVTGFLGSGKTSLLRHLAQQHRARRVVFLVNEFSAVDIDGSVLEAEIPGQVIGLPGGSIFCVCLVSEFIHVLGTLPERFSGSGAAPEGIIIEASGVANPTVIERMLEETRLDALYRIASVIAVADPGSFSTLLQTLPNIRAQIEASGHIVINKIDLYDEDTLRETEEAIRAIHPRAHIVRAVYGQAALEIFGERELRRLDGAYAACIDPHYGKASVRIQQPVQLQSLLEALRNLGAGVYRAKGFVPTSSGVFYVDVTPSGAQTTPIPDFAGHTDFALIAAPEAAEAVRALVAEIKTGKYNAGG